MDVKIEITDLSLRRQFDRYVVVSEGRANNLITAGKARLVSEINTVEIEVNKNPDQWKNPEIITEESATIFSDPSKRVPDIDESLFPDEFFKEK